MARSTNATPTCGAEVTQVAAAAGLAAGSVAHVGMAMVQAVVDGTPAQGQEGISRGILQPPTME